MTFVYLGCLLFSLTGVAIMDARWKLALWARPLRTIVGALLATSVFIVWDVAGIVLGVFLHAPSPLASGIMLAPQFPIEELVFLVFLSYLTLVLLGAAERFERRPKRRKDEL